MRSENRIGDQEMKSALSALSDGEVVRRVRAGDTALFEVLMRRHNQRVYRAVRSILRDEREVEDAMQQAWLAAYAHLDQFEGASAFSTWLTRIALNEGLARLRQRAKLTPLDDVPEQEIQAMRTAPIDPEGRAADRELARMLEQAVDALPELYRSVFVLREIEGLSTADAAESMGVSEEVVKGASTARGSRCAAGSSSAPAWLRARRSRSWACAAIGWWRGSSTRCPSGRPAPRTAGGASGGAAIRRGIRAEPLFRPKRDRFHSPLGYATPPRIQFWAG